MLSEYLNIATFQKNENTLTKFFIERNKINIYETKKPEDDNLLSKIFYCNGCPEELFFFEKPIQDWELYLKTGLIKVMLIFMNEVNSKKRFRFPKFDIDKIIQSDWFVLKEMLFDEAISIEAWNFDRFYCGQDFKEYFNLTNNFESYVLNSCEGLFKSHFEILLAELILKNIDLKYFIIDVELVEKVPIIDSEGKVFQNRLINQDHRYYNLSFNIFKCLSGSENNVFRAICDCTHLSFSVNNCLSDSFEKSFNWIVNSSFTNANHIRSNITSEQKNMDLIEINVKNILRYSQNYIAYFERLKTKCDNTTLSDFFDYVFHISIVIPDLNWAEEYKGRKKIWGINREQIESSKMVVNPRYKKLANKINISSDYFSYCKNMFLVVYDTKGIWEGQNIYDIDLFITIPFWEISRIQQLNLETAFNDEYEKMAEDEQDYIDQLENDKNYFNAAEDGLSDFYDADPGWGWNID